MNEIDAAKIQAAALEKIAKAITDLAKVILEFKYAKPDYLSSHQYEVTAKGE